MTLVPHWRRVLLRASSLWAVYGPILFEIAIQLLHICRSVCRTGRR